MHPGYLKYYFTLSDDQMILLVLGTVLPHNGLNTVVLAILGQKRTRCSRIKAVSKRNERGIMPLVFSLLSVLYSMYIDLKSAINFLFRKNAKSISKLKISGVSTQLMRLINTFSSYLLFLCIYNILYYKCSRNKFFVSLSFATFCFHFLSTLTIYIQLIIIHLNDQDEAVTCISISMCRTLVYKVQLVLSALITHVYTLLYIFTNSWLFCQPMLPYTLFTSTPVFFAQSLKVP